MNTDGNQWKPPLGKLDENGRNRRHRKRRLPTKTDPIKKQKMDGRPKKTVMGNKTEGGTPEEEGEQEDDDDEGSHFSWGANPKIYDLHENHENLHKKHRLVVLMKVKILWKNQPFHI